MIVFAMDLSSLKKHILIIFIFYFCKSERTRESMQPTKQSKENKNGSGIRKICILKMPETHHHLNKKRLITCRIITGYVTRIFSYPISFWFWLIRIGCQFLLFCHHPCKVEIIILHLIQPSPLFIDEMDDKD